METKLSEAEHFLWEYMMNHIQEIPNLSIIKLSERANVSTTTIVRTMKKKGYEGYTSFKHHLKEKKNTTINFATVDKVDEEIKTSILKNEQEVVRTINLLDTGVIEDAIQKIWSSQRIIIFARGFSEMIGEEIQTKFQLLDKYCVLHTDPNIIKTVSRKLHKKDVVLFISLNGETEELVAAAENCYREEISSILITASRESRLNRLAELSLIGFKSEISFFPEYEVRSRLPLSVIARILLDSYAIRVKKGGLRNKYKKHQSPKM